ncbi:hypothetical protein [Nitrincola tapanii]|uniref:Uncharacterized protein n=1 Tax=Nitrincola tapanii TaxID=1708751 RepID=A0A5A9W334_9GAMM|nr:hypothetical protein [Nitrincola tapanii]KAA0874609.1 hypothetical protein E1H14_07205 [Nitrincola tapanii]
MSTSPLPPVFSVLLAGHRQQRLQRGYSAEVQAQRQEQLQQTLTTVLSHLAQEAVSAFALAQKEYLPLTPELRLLTGTASGVDALGRDLAPTLGYRLHLMSAQSSAEVFEAERNLVLGMQPSSEMNALQQSDYSLRDDLLLSFADLLVAVWDRSESAEIKSGTAKLIRSALLKRKPVLLIRFDAVDAVPQLQLCDTQKLGESETLELETFGHKRDVLEQFFLPSVESMEALQAPLRLWVQRLLCPFVQVLPEVAEQEAQLRLIDAQPSFFAWLGTWCRYVWSGRKTPVPLSFVRWCTQALFWLKWMLNPPSVSAEQRLLHLLQRPVLQQSLQRRWIHRVHRFGSALARLEWREAFLAPKSVSHPACSEPSSLPLSSLDIAFVRADEAAHYYACAHRDGIWLVYFAAAFAVFCAVAGTLQLWPATQVGLVMFWAVGEFVLLRFIVGQVLQARYKDWHGRWMSYRFLAEQLRYLRIGYAMLVLPKALDTSAWYLDTQHQFKLKHPEVWILQRLLIAQGLPQTQTAGAIYHLAQERPQALQAFKQALSEHRHYFSHSYHHLHREHVYLHRLALILFVITFCAVTLHFFVKISWILIFTAFFPAWGAAIHGVLTHNEVVRMSAMAGVVWSKLEYLHQALSSHPQTLNTSLDSPTAWTETGELRQLIGHLIMILADENQTWRSLLQHNPPDLPA